MDTTWRVVPVFSSRSVRIDLDPGSGLDLRLDERRLAGRAIDPRPEVPLTGLRLPPGISGVVVRTETDGRQIETTYEPAPGLTHTLDVGDTGEPVARPRSATVRVGWTFRRRGLIPARTRWWDRSVLLDTWDSRGIGLGGLTPARYHHVDPATGTLWTGTGRRTVTKVYGKSELVDSGLRPPGLPRIEDDEIVSFLGSTALVFDRAGFHRRSVDLGTGRVQVCFEHDSQMRLTRWEQPRPREVYEVDHSGTETRITAPGELDVLLTITDSGITGLTPSVGGRVGIEYDEAGLIRASSGPRGQLVTLEHDEEGALAGWAHNSGERLDLTETAAGPPTRLTVITAEGREVTETSEAGEGGHRVTRRCCGEISPRVETTNGFGKTVEYPDGSVRRTRTWASRVPGPGNSVSRTSIRTAEGRTRVIEVERRSNRNGANAVTTLDGRSWRRSFDASSGVVTETGPSGYEDRVTLVPEVTMTVERAGQGPVVTEFDGDLPSRILDGERRMSFAYDRFGRLAELRDGEETRRVEHDSAGRVTGLELSRGWFRITYDEGGAIDSVTTPGGGKTGFQRTVDGLLSEVKGPPTRGGSTRIRFEYDRDRRTVAREVLGGNRVEYDRDEGGRIIAVDGPELHLTVEHRPDSGRISSVTTADGDSVTWESDGPLPVSERAAGRVTGATEWRYDHGFEPRSLVVNGVELVLDRDTNGDLIRFGPMYLERGCEDRLVRRCRIDSVTVVTDYDDRGAVSSLSAESGSEVLFRQDIRRDERGRVIETTETDRRGSRTITYEYEADGLSRVEIDGVPSLELERDDNGNTVAYHRPDSTTSARYGLDDRLLFLDGHEIATGPAGEVLGDDQRSYTFDALDSLRTVDWAEDAGGSHVDHVHDGLGRLIESSMDGAPQLRVLWRGTRPAAVAGSDGVWRICVGDGANGPRVLVGEDDTLCLITDHRGDVRMVVNAADGEVLEMIDYDPLGRIVFDSDPGLQPFGFSGGLHDRSTGLVHLGRRVLDPRTSRFLTRDPLAFDGGQANLYVYGGSDPVNMGDPTGTRSTARGGVEVCTAPFIGSRDTVSIDHVFLRTENWSRGQGINPDQPWYEKLRFVTEWVDETTNPQGKDRSSDQGQRCRPVENVDEQCLERHTGVGTRLGRYGLEADAGSVPGMLEGGLYSGGASLEPNICYDAVYDALDACAGPGGWEYGDGDEGPGLLADAYRVLHAARTGSLVRDTLADWFGIDL